MAKSRSQAAAFDIMAGLGKEVVSTPASSAGAGVETPAAKKPQAARSRQSGDKRPTAAKPRSKARSGPVPSERPLKARNTLLFEDQLRPLALLEIDTGESRSELIRRLLDEELERKGYL